MKSIQHKMQTIYLGQQPSTTLRSLVRSLPPGAYPQPSLRIPVTLDNKEHLRALRAAEAEAFDAVRPTHAL